MRLALNLCLFLFALVISGDKAFSLTDSQIKKFCKTEKNTLKCKRDLREKRFDLQKGKLIEIPVIPKRI